MKIAPLYHALKKEDWCDVKIIHTGQHYDPLLSDIFFEQLKLPQPHFSLNIGSGSHAEQTGQTMIAYEQLLQKNQPDLCIVVGDVNATLACTLAAKKCLIPVAHVEAGLRSFDMSMPEEINRIVVDRICDLHLTPSEDGNINLLNEGVSKNSIKCVGNVMIDSLEFLRAEIKESLILEKLVLEEKKYAVLTLHRPINVDYPDNLKNILLKLAELGDVKFIFPVHPRNSVTINKLGLDKKLKNIHFMDPSPYVDFIRLIMGSRFVVTDSGGIQEETTYLGIPCFTLRDSTERPITITQGTNQLVTLANLVQTIKGKDKVKISTIPFWDGMASNRIVAVLKNYLGVS
jgi:UDP-N-acetylglucosamine 2-epimerase (non-hydrolysing)